MRPETTAPEATKDLAGIEAVFVRAAGGHQSWESVSTSREFEVAERHAVLPASLLQPGDLGLITYTGATAFLRRIQVVPRPTPAVAVNDGISWIRAAIAELGCDAPVEALETAAVTRMAASSLVADRREHAQWIGRACARLGRHRQAAIRSDVGNIG